MFYKQNLLKCTGKHLRWSLCNLILKRDSSTGVFLWILQTFSEYLFYWIPGRLLLTFHCNSLIKKNLSDFSTMRCLVLFGNSLVKRPQLNLLFTLRLPFLFKYLKSQNMRVLSQDLQLNHILIFFIKML